MKPIHFHRRRTVLLFALGLLVLSLFWLHTIPVYADDCTRDPLNAADCMRTPGFREGISGALSTISALATALTVALAGSTTGQAPGTAPTTVPPGYYPRSPQSPPPQPPTSPPPPPQEMARSGPPPQPQTYVEPQPQGPKPQPAPSQAPGAAAPEDKDGWGTTIFNAVKDATSYVGGVVGAVGDFKFDSPEALEMGARIALRLWNAMPDKEAAEMLQKKMKLFNQAGKVREWSDKLSKAGKVLDVIEAGMKAHETCKKHGYTGVDKAMIYTSEVLKKGLTWTLTKNPYVAVVDLGVGAATHAIFGAEGKIDIGSTIDRAATAWDNVTREHFENITGVSVDKDNVVRDSASAQIKQIAAAVREGRITREKGKQMIESRMELLQSLGGQ